MKLKIAIAVCFMFAGIYSYPQTSNHFTPNVYTELPASAVKPQGWLLHQLQIMRDGTTGHLDEVYAKLKNDNGWLGGKGDGWEETPYWLDGAVPLAYLLHDDVLIRKVENYINWIISNQRPSGYFGPVTEWERSTGKKIGIADCDKGEDWWPKMIVLKIVQQYYLATNDPRSLRFLTNYFHYQLAALQHCNIGKWTEWATARGTDNMLVAQWLYGITKDVSLLKLSSLIQSQAFSWSKWFAERDWVMNAAAHQNDSAWMTRHGVNVGMGLKDPVVNYQRTGDKKYLQTMRRGWNDIMLLHGLPNGAFSADEDLHGNDPSQGSELCAIVEAMFSLEQAIGITGETQYMDALEKMAFNALPTQTTDDYNNKQYFQIANQVNIKRGVFQFSLPFGREMNNVLGMRSGYTCCLANMHQGWTKFATHLWFGAANNGIAALHFSPSVVSAKLGVAKTPVTINESTSYPFNDVIDFTIQSPSSVAFPFSVRIPAWCKNAVVRLNGAAVAKPNAGEVYVLNRVWKNGDRLTLQLPMQLAVAQCGSNARSIERGPLVYALKLPEKWEKDVQEKEGEYYSVFTDASWNYGLVDSMVSNPSANIRVAQMKQAGDDFVWNLAHAPVELQLQAKKIPDWKIVQDVAPLPVTSRDGLYLGKVAPDAETITLVPYGCTKVRIVSFPVVR